MLGLLQDRVEKLRVPWLGRRRTAAEQSRVWTAVARVVARRPVLWATASVLLLLALTLRAAKKHTAGRRTDQQTASVAMVDGAVHMQETFPGAAAPAKVVVWGDADSGAVRRAIDRLRGQVTSRASLFGGTVLVQRLDRVSIVRVPLAGQGTDRQSNRALEALRHRLLPATLGRVPNARYAVSGRTAFAYDFTSRVRVSMPTVFAFVLVMAFVLLTVAFRSLAIALVSIILNLLSIGAAYGVLTWIFQDGNLRRFWGSSLTAVLSDGCHCSSSRCCSG